MFALPRDQFDTRVLHQRDRRINVRVASVPDIAGCADGTHLRPGTMSNIVQQAIAAQHCTGHA